MKEGEEQTKALAAARILERNRLIARVAIARRGGARVWSLSGTISSGSLLVMVGK